MSYSFQILFLYQLLIRLNKIDQELIESMNKYRMNSKKDEIKFDNYIKINNTNLTPQDVADIIINKFNLNKI